MFRRMVLNSRLNGLPLIPSPLVGAARLFFQTQGMNPSVVSDSGEISADALVALAFDKVEIRTALTPPVTINLKEASSGEVSQLIKDIQPAIILSGRAGTHTIAPAGIPNGSSTRVAQATGIGAMGIGAAVLGLLALGRAFLK